MHAHTYSPKLTHQWWFFLDKFYVTFSSCLLTCTSSSLAMTILLELIGKKKKERKQWNAQLKVKKQNKAKRESHNLGAFICFSKCKELSCRAWWVSLPTLCIPVILLLQSDDGGILMPFVLCLFHTGAGAALWWVLLTRTPSTLLTSGSCSRRLSTPPGFSPAATLAVRLPLNFPMTYYSWTVTLFFFFNILFHCTVVKILNRRHMMNDTDWLWNIEPACILEIKHTWLGYMTVFTWYRILFVRID